jgi:hypothetical protein
VVEGYGALEDVGVVAKVAGGGVWARDFEEVG